MQALALQVSPPWSGGSIPCRLWPYRLVLTGQAEVSHAGFGLTGQSSVVRRKYPMQALALQVSPQWSGGSIPCRLWPYRLVLTGQEEVSHAGFGLTG